MTRQPAKARPDVQIYDDEWVTIAWKGQREKCCGCGLIHRVDYRVSDGTTAPAGALQFRGRQVTR